MSERTESKWCPLNLMGEYNIQINCQNSIRFKLFLGVRFKGVLLWIDHAPLLNEWTLNFTYSPFKYKNLWIFQTVGLVKQSFLFPLVHFQSLYKYRVTLKYLNCKDDIRLLKNDDTKVKLALLMASLIIWQIFKLHTNPLI